MIPISPAWLLLGLLAVPIVWAYLWRPPPPRRLVSSLLLVRRLARTEAPRRVRVRRWISLALMLLALAASTIGLAFLSSAASLRVLLVADRSASMGAVIEGQSRWARASSWLDGWLDRHPGAEVAMLGAPPLAWEVDFTRDSTRLRLGEPDLGSGDVTPMLEGWCALGRDLVLLSEAIPAPAGCRVERPDLGGTVANAGITALVVGARDALGRSEVHLTVQATTPGPVPVSLAVDDTPVQTLTVQAQGSASLLLRLPPGRSLRLALPPDALPADDLAMAPLGAGAPVRVRLVGDDPWLRAALGAHPRVVDGGEPALVVLAAEGPVPDGPLVAAFGVAVLPVDAAVSEPHVTAVAEGDPLLAWVDLRDLHIGRARPLRPPAGALVLVDSDQGPLAVRVPREGGDLVAFGFAPGDTDQGLRVAFANLVANLVDEAVPPAEPGQGQGVLSPQETLSPVLPAEGGLPGGPEPWPLAALLALGALLVEWRLGR